MRILVCLFFTLFSMTYAKAASMDEIESLLRYVGSIEGASFIRNGDIHTPKEAEAHLRLKWTKQKSQILTAEDFIRLCGTKSSTSGKPYVIRFKDGHEEEAAVVLYNQLQIVRAKPTASIQGTPNQALEPTTPAVMIPAAQEVTPAAVVAHL